MKHISILIMDDLKGVRYILKEHLAEFLTNKFELTFIEAENAKEGVEKFEEYHPDFVIADMLMNGLSGYEALKGMKELENKDGCKPLKSAIISGYSMDEAEKAIEEGLASHRFLKPINYMQVADLIAKEVSDA